MKTLMILAVLGSAVGAKAQEAAWTADEVAVVSPCACAKKAMCWAAVMAGYKIVANKAMIEIEGSFPNRFFADSEAVALEKTDQSGNFLLVRCENRRAVCSDKRDELQRRVIFSSFLSVLPVPSSEGVLFDPHTWAISDNGERVLAKLRRCKPGFLGQLAGAMAK